MSAIFGRLHAAEMYNTKLSKIIRGAIFDFIIWYIGLQISKLIELFIFSQFKNNSSNIP